MDLRRLRYFVQVAELGSFSRAAARLGVAQPALSRQVRRLEADLGVDLLYRNGHGVAPTAAGERLLAEGGPLLATADRLAADIAGSRNVPRGEVTLGMPPSVSMVLAAPLIRRCRAACPEVTLRVVDGFSGHVHEWLQAGRLDVAILYNARRSPTIATQELLEELLFVLGPRAPGSPLTAERRDAFPVSALAGLPLILPGRDHGLRRVVDAGARRARVALDVVLEVDALSAIKEMVGDGMGYAVLPYSAVLREVAEGRFAACRLTRPELINRMEVATSMRRPVTLAAREVVQAVRAEVRDLVAAGKLAGRA